MPNRLAVCSWSLQPESCDDLIAKLAPLKDAGVTAVQLHLNPLSEPAWANTPQRLADAGIAIVSGMVTTVGEDYATLETIKATGGIVPDAVWPDNQAAFDACAQHAKDAGVTLVSTHIGFIPHDPADPTYGPLTQRVQTIADAFATHGLTLLFETGQETAPDLNAFLDALDRPNVGVNFDPANMLLYGKGDPIDALRGLLPRVQQVHLKDATSSDQPGVTWGSEVPVGQGEVDWPTFVAVLKEGNYTGDLALEREAGSQRTEDLTAGATYIAKLLGA